MVVCWRWIIVFARPRCNAAGIGADIVIHSATKYLDGQGRCIAGGGGTEDVVGKDVYAFCARPGRRSAVQRVGIFERTETLKLRMQAHSAVRCNWRVGWNNSRR